MVDRRKVVAAAGALAAGAVGAGLFALFQRGEMADYDAAVASTREALSKTPDLRGLIRHATLAANSHNTQPWWFRLGERRVDIAPDLARKLEAVDPDNHHLFASLGCAAENLAIAAGSRGHNGEVRFEPADGGSVAFRWGAGAAGNSALADAIPKRQSTRSVYDGKAVSAGDLASILAVAAIPGVDIVLFTDRSHIDRVRDLVLSANSAQMADPAFRSELKRWLRFSPHQAMDLGDGLFSAASGSPALPTWLGPLAFDLMFQADSENDKYARQIDSSAGIAIFVSERDDKEHWMLAGRACQRFALQATVLGIKTAFINQPVEVARMRPELASLASMPERRPDLVMRFGYGPLLPFSSRRTVEEVLR